MNKIYHTNTDNEWSFMTIIITSNEFNNIKKLSHSMLRTFINIANIRRSIKTLKMNQPIFYSDPTAKFCAIHNKKQLEQIILDSYETILIKI